MIIIIKIIIIYITILIIIIMNIQYFTYNGMNKKIFYY